MKLLMIFLYSLTLPLAAKPYKEFKKGNMSSLEELQRLGDKKIDDISITTLSPNAITIIFNSLHQINYIPFEFIEDGCYAQAHEISLVLEEFNIKSAKVFIMPTTDKLLYPKIQQAKLDKNFVGWKYHVAPLIISSFEGVEEFIVLDPTTGNTPQTIEQWAKNMGLSKDEYKIEITPLEKIFNDRNYTTKESIIGDLIKMNEQRKEMGEDMFWWAYDKGLL